MERKDIRAIVEYYGDIPQRIKRLERQKSALADAKIRELTADRDAVNVALACIDGRQRDIIEARHVEGRQWVSIAMQYQVAISTAEKWYNAGLRLLCGELEESTDAPALLHRARRTRKHG
ncbi:MAG: hypothetical protein LIO54_03550 [Oscillospiraceae bacterium]|nr:hypothetical protein [Oscillospiraceae bacterium]